jgi:hypothetical protein
LTKRNVDAPGLLLHDLDQAVEVGETRCVATDASCVGANPRDGLVELGLAAAGDEDARSFGGEQSRRREADAGGPARYHRDFPLKLPTHRACSRKFTVCAYAHIICHCARHHRALLANRGFCSHCLPMGFGGASGGRLFSITNVSDGRPRRLTKPRLCGTIRFSKAISIAAFRNTKHPPTFEKETGRRARRNTAGVVA